MKPTFKQLIKLWIILWVNARIGTEYRKVSAGFETATKRHKKPYLVTITDDEFTKVDQIAQCLKHFDLLSYEVFMHHYSMGGNAKARNRFIKSKNMSATTYFKTLAVAEGFMRGGLVTANVI